jgi:ATP-dependent DNA helicase 2 subunit 2
MVVDVGHSMDDPFSDDASRAKIALECCKLTLQQKIFNNSTHELGLVLFGDNDSDDGNSLLLQALEKPTVDFVRKVEQLSLARFDNTKTGGDIFSAINYSLNLMDDHIKKRKYNKRMFLFTNGTGQSSFAREDMMELADRLMAVQVKLNIVPIDFMTSYDLAENKLEGEMMESVQEENAELLIELKRLAEDFVQIFPASLAIELYKRFRKKDTTPVARYKGFLEFAPGLEVEVSTYKAIRR